MSSLCVIDASACVYTGSCSKHFTDRYSYKFPVGGIHYLMRQVCVALSMGNSVVLCFDSPSNRSLEFSGYKSGRRRRPEVFSQLKLVYEELSSCKVACEKHKGYEADDIIQWVVEQQKDNFYETVIIGNDHDLLHSVQNKVRFKSIAVDKSCIHVGNFESLADKTFTLFNTISAKKCLCGCVSDSIPAFSTVGGMSGSELYDKFLQFLEDNEIGRDYSVTTNPKLLLIFAKKSGMFCNEDFIQLQKRIKLVYPANCPGIQIIPSAADTIDFSGLLEFLSAVNDTDCLTCLHARKVPVSDRLRDKLFEEAKRLQTGEFAADNNVSAQPLIQMEVFDEGAFERRF